MVYMLFSFSIYIYISIYNQNPGPGALGSVDSSFPGPGWNQWSDARDMGCIGPIWAKMDRYKLISDEI